MTQAQGFKYIALLASLQLLAIPAEAIAAPAPPSGLSAIGFSTSRIDLAWSDNSSSETGFRIERAADAAGAPGQWALLANVGSNVRKYSHTGLAYGAKYWYRVRAFNRISNSAYSNSVSTSTLIAVSLRVSNYPVAVVAGASNSLSVAALDSKGNVATGYPGVVRLASSDPASVLPADSALPSGTATFPVVLKTAGVQSISAQDTVNAAVHGTQDSINVSPAQAARLTLTLPMPGSAIAGTALTLVVNVYDSYNNLATGYQGTVSFNSNDSAATLPTPYTFVAADAGSKALSATFNTAGTRSLTASDLANSTITATESGIVVTAASANRLIVRGYPSNLLAGTTANFTVTAVDSFGNTASDYSGMIHFSSSDAQAVLPADSTLNLGTQSFAATFNTIGIHTLSAQDSIQSTIAGSQSGISISAPPPACVGGVWKNLANQQLVHAGPGLREPPVGPTYGYFQSPSTQTSIVTPTCPYFLGLVRLPIFMVDWTDFHPETDSSNPNNPGATGLAGYVQATSTELDYYVNGPTGAAQYFRDVSGRKADIAFDVFNWTNSSTPGSYLKPRTDYITLNVNNVYQCNKNGIFLDAVRNAVAYAGADLKRYDADGNGIMDGAILMYEGQGGLCSGGNLSYLSGAAGLGNPPTFKYQDARTLVTGSDPNSGLFANQTVYVEYYNNLPERAFATTFYYVATWVHELGHLLLGYPDYYDTKFNIGSWALSGNHSDIPTHPAAFEKWLFARWIEPQAIQNSGQYTLAANEIADGAGYEGNTYLYRIVIDGDPRKFITIENRWFDNAGNTGTQWARAYGRESGLQIVEFNLGVDIFTTPPQLYRQVPARTDTLSAYRSFRPGDSFSKCYQTMCVTIDQIGAPGQQVGFSVTISPQ